MICICIISKKMSIHKTTPFHRMESNRSRSEVFLSILTNWRGDIFTKYALFTGKIFLGNSICDNHLIFSMSPQQFGFKLLPRPGNILPCLAKKPLEGFFLGENKFSRLTIAFGYIMTYIIWMLCIWELKWVFIYQFQGILWGVRILLEHCRMLSVTSETLSYLI